MTQQAKSPSLTSSTQHHDYELWQDVQACERARLSRDHRFDGKFYTAVITTGIFCRPICPARPPKPENVQYFQSAVHAQQAGFQPCKRCIPEHAPSLNLPAKLKRMADAMELCEGKISTLATRFDISERQLHRLFIKEFGVSPSKYFHHQRLLLARKLLVGTTLSITDVCFAAGFQSIRRFNEAIKATYNCNPSELRKNNKSQNQDNYVSILLSYRPPFDWPLMLGFLKHRQMVNVEQVTNESYARIFQIEQANGWLEVCHHNKKPALVLKVQLSDYKYLNQVITKVKRIFDLDADMAAIHQHLAKHAQLAKVVKQSPGLRLPGSWDIFEFSIRAILGQQISVKAATTYANRIAMAYGDKSESNPFELTHYFPTVEKLQMQSFDKIGLTNTRIATIKRWLEFYSEQKGLLDTYQNLEELEKKLVNIKGIGPWTVNYIAMRGLSDPDAFPSADLGIIKALAKDDTAKKLTNKEILALSENWRPWRAYAAIYLWQSLANKEKD